MNGSHRLSIFLLVAGVTCLSFAMVIHNSRNQNKASYILSNKFAGNSQRRFERTHSVSSDYVRATSPMKYRTLHMEILSNLPDVKSNGLAGGWVDDSTVSQGTYTQQDNSARLIYPWAYESDAFDLRRDRPFDWFDDDDPREANYERAFLADARK